MDHYHHLLARRRLALALLAAVLSCHALRTGCAAAPSSSPAAGHDDRLRVALDAAARSVEEALATLTTAAPRTMFSTGRTARSSSFNPALAAAAREDCEELLGDALRLLAGARDTDAARDDALAWLSAALTGHDTCADGLAEAGLVSGENDDVAALDAAVPGLAAARAKVQDALAMLYDASTAPSSEPPAPNATTTTNHGGCANATTHHPSPRDACGFPRWLPCPDQRLPLLLSSSPSPAAAAVADLVVAQDGTGTHTTINDAVDAAPECSPRRTVIHVKAGTYHEVVKVGSRKTNLVFVGAGAGRTVVTGNVSAAGNNVTTFQTATFAAKGSGFMMLDMTVDNTAGPARRQAVALRVSADRAVVYRCTILGHQDTLYVHSGRQFYSDCDVRGTVDFVFGNAAAVLQRCTLRSRVPLPGQKDTVTAQNRKEPCQETGIVLHACSVVAETDDLNAAAGAPSSSAALAPSPASSATPPPMTYLGRPWRPYSRVVVMRSYIGVHVPPQGWLQWNATAPVDTLYYAEYMNYGPGAGVAGRVSWRGHRVISAAEAERFTVARFIGGASWLPATGVSFIAGLDN